MQSHDAYPDPSAYSPGAYCNGAAGTSVAATEPYIHPTIPLIPAVLEGSRWQDLHIFNLQDPPHQRFRYTLTLGDLDQRRAQVLPHPVYGVHPCTGYAPAPSGQLALRPGPVQPLLRPSADVGSLDGRHPGGDQRTS